MFSKLAVLTLSLALTITLAAQDKASTATVTKDPAAAAIARNALLGMGGGALKNYEDADATGTLSIYGGLGSQTLNARIRTRGQNDFRLDFEAKGGTDSYVSGAATGCMKRAERGAYKTADFTAYSQGVELIPALSLLSRYQEATMNLQYAGETVVDGKNVAKIALTATDAQSSQGLNPTIAAQRSFYIDKETGLVTKVVFRTLNQKNYEDGTLVEIVYASYRVINGIAVPFSRSLYINDRHASDLALESVAFNTGITDSTFSMTCGN